jgi:hypothetical protein
MALPSPHDSSCDELALQVGAARVDVSARESVASWPGEGDVETAVAAALTRAAEAGRWDVVTRLARELEARRLASGDNVVRLDDARRKEGA